MDCRYRPDRPTGTEKSLQPLIHHPEIGSGDGHGHALFFEEGRRKDETAFFFLLPPSCMRASLMTHDPTDPTHAETQAAAELLPAVYAELRRLAAVLSKRLPPGQTLQPTALVHEAYMKLVRDHDPGWQGRRHFFAAAAQAMREILERRKERL
jgi:hypothetical protein